MSFVGFGDDYLLRSGSNYIAAWNRLLDLAAPWKFNTIRLAFSAPGQGTAGASTLDLARLEEVISLLASRGMKVMLDLHNYGDHLGYVGTPEFEALWLELAQIYGGDPRVAFFQPINEATKATWAPGIVTVEDYQLYFASFVGRLRDAGVTQPVLLSDCNQYRHWGWDYVPGSVPPNTIQSIHYNYSPGQAPIESWQDYLAWLNSKVMHVKDTYGLRVYSDEISPFPPREMPWEGQLGFCSEAVNFALVETIGFATWQYRWNWEQGHDYEGLTDLILEASNYVPGVTPPVSRFSLRSGLATGGVVYLVTRNPMISILSGVAGGLVGGRGG